MESATVAFMRVSQPALETSFGFRKNHSEADLLQERRLQRQKSTERNEKLILVPLPDTPPDSQRPVAGLAGTNVSAAVGAVSGVGLRTPVSLQRNVLTPLEKVRMSERGRSRMRLGELSESDSGTIGSSRNRSKVPSPRPSPRPGKSVSVKTNSFMLCKKRDDFNVVFRNSSETNRMKETDEAP